jgi:hypothetical protein
MSTANNSFLVAINWNKMEQTKKKQLKPNEYCERCKRIRKTKNEHAAIILKWLCVIFSTMMLVSVAVVVFFDKELRIMEMGLVFFQSAITAVLGFLFGSHNKQ